MSASDLRFLGGRRHHGGAFETEAEVLQTDVMRFMALLGFVLVGIFALVQALPMTAGDPRPALEQEQALRSDLDALQRHVAERRRELASIRARLEAARVEAEQASERARRAQRQLAQTLAESRAAQSELERHRRALDSVREALDGERRALSELRARVERRRRALSELEQRIAALREDAADDRSRARVSAATTDAPDAAAQQAAPAASGETETASETTTEPEDSVPRRGFVLKFESEAAFDRLVERGAIEFYALVGERAWRASSDRGATRYSPTEQPETYHQMARHTVPRSYLASFRETVAAMDASAIQWATVLPPPIEDAIREAVAGREGGAILIQGDGTVRLEEGEA